MAVDDCGGAARAGAARTARGIKVRAHLCAVAGAATAILCAILVFHMPVQLATVSFAYGMAYGLLKIVWIVVAAVYLYDITVATGQFEIMKHSVAGITADRRLQLLLIAFCFGVSIEGAADLVRRGDRRGVHDRTGL